MLKKANKKRFHFSKIEIHDLVKAWLILSLAFAIFFVGGFGITTTFFTAFIVSLLTVGTAFILHELGHKFLAQHYGCFAEFRSFDFMLILSVIMSFFGFVFIAPGAVMIFGPIGKKRNGIISMLGPLTNILLALIFAALFLLTPLKLVGQYGFVINSWLALFNLIPISFFDGKKIFDWNKAVYWIMVVAVIGLIFLQEYLKISL